MITGPPTQVDYKLKAYLPDPSAVCRVLLVLCVMCRAEGSDLTRLETIRRVGDWPLLWRHSGIISLTRSDISESVFSKVR